MKHTARFLAMLLAAALLIGLCACGGNDETQEDPNTRPTTYDGQNSLDAILDYADRLEAAGNAEAAALYDSFEQLAEALAAQTRHLLILLTDEGLRLMADCAGPLDLPPVSADVERSNEDGLLYLTLRARKGGGQA